MLELLAAGSLLSNLAASQWLIPALVTAAATIPDEATRQCGRELLEFAMKKGPKLQDAVDLDQWSKFIDRVENTSGEKFPDINGARINPALCAKLLARLFPELSSGLPCAPLCEDTERTADCLPAAPTTGSARPNHSLADPAPEPSINDKLLSTFTDLLADFLATHPSTAEDSAAVQTAIRIAGLFPTPATPSTDTPAALIRAVLTDLRLAFAAKDFAGARETLWGFVGARPVAAFSLLLALALHFAPGTVAGLVLTPLGMGVLGPVAEGVAAVVQGPEAVVGSVLAVVRGVVMGGEGGWGWVKRVVGGWAAGQVVGLGKEVVGEAVEEKLGRERFGEAWPWVKAFWEQEKPEGFRVWKEPQKCSG